MSSDPTEMTNKQLRYFQDQHAYLYKRVPFPYPGSSELPYRRSGPFDDLKRKSLQHILDPNGKVWAKFWKSEEHGGGDN